MRTNLLAVHARASQGLSRRTEGKQIHGSQVTGPGSLGSRLRRGPIPTIGNNPGDVLASFPALALRRDLTGDISQAATAIQIFVTDISDTALDRARTGLYTEAAVSEISADRLKRFFIRLDGGFQVNKSIRDMCIFAKQNLVKDPPFSLTSIW
jgi:CheR methyltransferase, SAM binding domain